VLQKRRFKVVGHFKADGASFESEIWGDAKVLMPAFHRESGYQTIVFRMRDPSQFATIKKRLEDDPRLGVQVQRERDFYTEQSQATTMLIRGIGIFITAIMAIGALFGAANTMFAAVAGRTREIATLLVLGFSPWAVMVSFMIESTLVALTGGVLGCLLALPINGITTSTTNFRSFSEVAFQFRVTPELMIKALISRRSSASSAASSPPCAPPAKPPPQPCAAPDAPRSTHEGRRAEGLAALRASGGTHADPGLDSPGRCPQSLPAHPIMRLPPCPTSAT
jgi:ABC-type lipoprotein release transport system permease subunit